MTKTPNYKKKFDETYSDWREIIFPKHKKISSTWGEGYHGNRLYEVITVPREIVEHIFAQGWKMALSEKVHNEHKDT